MGIKFRLKTSREERDHSEDIGVDWKIILDRILGI
jgi:hypothetical protein